MVASRKRVQCRACGRRVLGGLTVCPHCGHHPGYLHSRGRPTIASVLLGVAAGIVLFVLVPGVAATMTGFVPTLEPTPVVVVWARPTFTPSPTATPRPTATSTTTPTPEPTSTTTPTLPPAPTTAQTSTPTPTPRPTVPPPRLVLPPDGVDYGGGPDAEIVLVWEGRLQEGQQFAVILRFVNRSDGTETRGTYTRDSRWKVDPAIFKDINLNLRALKWDVTVIDMAGNALGPPSESRIFTWH
ncbi:MAG: hypothetical protein HZB53_13600 [Chloroflexi bacterium]|nr:hypothetical protein [Chloroflexota bacterium]